MKINNVEKAMPAKDGVSLRADIEKIRFDFLNDIANELKELYENVQIDEACNKQPLNQYLDTIGILPLRHSLHQDSFYCLLAANHCRPL